MSWIKHLQIPRHFWFTKKPKRSAHSVRKAAQEMTKRHDKALKELAEYDRSTKTD